MLCKIHHNIDPDNVRCQAMKAKLQKDLLVEDQKSCQDSLTEMLENILDDNTLRSLNYDDDDITSAFVSFFDDF
jgi:hypothetical protein